LKEKEKVPAETKKGKGFIIKKLENYEIEYKKKEKQL